MTPLPFAPPVAPMLAKPGGSSVPDPDSVGGGLLYEPKWDGFRIIIFRQESSAVLQPRRADDLAYAFPDVVAEALRQLPPGTVVDGELVSAHDGRLWFEELGMRLRPRSEAGGWKIAELAGQYPASFVAFDVLAVSGSDLRSSPNRERRAALEALSQHWEPPFYRSPAITDPELARRWFDVFEGAGLDGVIARPLDAPYQPGKRTLLKVKHARTADVVVAGWRPHKSPGPDGSPVVGSLLLGLFDDHGRLHHVGVASSFSAARRAALVAELAAYADPDPEEHPWRQWLAAAESPSQRVPGAPSRWSGGKDLSWVPLQARLVAEVGYDHMEGDRFRHVASFKRWRPDREPASCTYEQLDRPLRFDLDRILAPGLPADVAAVVFEVVDAGSAAARAVLQAYFDEIGRSIPGGFDPGAAPDPAQDYNQPNGCFLLVADGPQTVGCGGITFRDEGTAEIKRMWIRPDFRGRGIAGRLLRRLEDAAQQAGRSRIVLDTNASLAPALALYRSAGYRAVPAYNHNPYADRWFAKDLDPLR